MGQKPLRKQACQKKRGRESRDLSETLGWGTVETFEWAAQWAACLAGTTAVLPSGAP